MMTVMMVVRMLVLILTERMFLITVLRERVRMTDVVLPIRRVSDMATASAMAPSAGECL
jgi:hypothetical protein